jgi:hypothetical protein
MTQQFQIITVAQLEKLEILLDEKVQKDQAMFEKAMEGFNRTFVAPDPDWVEAKRLAKLVEDARGEYAKYLTDLQYWALVCGPNDSHVGHVSQLQ